MNLLNHINTYQSEADYQNDKSKNFPNVSYIVENDNVLFVKEKTDYSNDYLTFEVVDGGNVTITASNADVAKTIQYSTDNGSTWTSLTTSTTAQELGGALSVGDKVLVKGTNTAYGTNSNYNTFGGTAKVNVYGNIMSLISGDSFANNKTLTDSYTFYRLFNSYTNLLSAENLILPATKLTTYCYYSMFQGCTSLVNVPVLPATTLANYCYDSMFKDCKNITTAPELPATTLAISCYYGMFNGTNVLPDCTNIDFTSKAVLDSGGLIGLFAGTKVTDSDLDRLLPKNTNGKYYLPATTLADYCYQRMFQGCTGLTTAPELPATTLADYCYQYMFFACTNLVNAPELPATTLANWCYGGMFFDCTSLTTAPTLPATTLANSCYYTMFYDCSSLNYIKCLATDISATECLTYWVYNVASSGTFVKNSAATWNVTGFDGIPTGWTVVNE